MGHQKYVYEVRKISSFTYKKLADHDRIPLIEDFKQGYKMVTQKIYVFFNPKS